MSLATAELIAGQGAGAAAGGRAWVASGRHSTGLLLIEPGDRWAPTLAGALPVVERARAEQTKDDVIELARDPDLAAAGIRMSYVDSATGRVVLTVRALTDALAARIVAGFGVERVAIEVNPALGSAATSSRQADRRPFWGGAHIITDYGVDGYKRGNCSSGFAWVSGSESRMLTAGHCIPLGGQVDTPVMHMGYVNSRRDENWTAHKGTQLLPQESVYRGDLALIHVTVGTSSPYIYRGNSSSSSYAKVTEMWHRRARVGDRFCTGGQATGEICGWEVEQVGVNFYFDKDRATARNVVVSARKGSPCTDHGDSGGPVYTVTPTGGIAAKGIISGTQTNPVPVLGGCWVIFTDIWDAYSGFPGHLKTTT